MKNFGEKFRELKVKGSRKKMIEESGARKSFQDRRGDSREQEDRRSTSRGSTFNRDRTQSGNRDFGGNYRARLKSGNQDRFKGRPDLRGRQDNHD